MKKALLPVFTLLLFASILPCYLLAQAKDSVHPRYTVAVFAPLYLDSAFDPSGQYRYDKSFPKFITPGLEFFEGIKLAADSLKTEKVPLNIEVFDTRSATQNLQQQLSTPGMEHVGLIIGHVTPAEAKTLAEAAMRKNIPFINANLPNDAGIVHNPSLVILNSTLQTHCEGIYRYLQKNYGTSNVILFRRKGQMEDRLQNYFTEAEKNTASVKLKTKFVTLDDTKPFVLDNYLDSTRLTVCIVASMDENFGRTIAQQLSASLEKFPALLVGMPTWDAITDFNRKEYKDLNIVYSTPFYNAKTDKTSNSINNYFKTYLYARPSDMVFRGYECMYRFGKLLADKGSNLNSSIGEKKYRLFTDWDIQPVLDRQSLTLDHFENKKLYFVRKMNGQVIGVN